MNLGYNIIDIIIVLVLMLFMIEGTIRGFVKSFFGLTNTIISLIMAKLLYGNLAVILKTVTDIDEDLTQWILQKQGAVLTEGHLASTAEAASLKMPELLHANFLSKLMGFDTAQHWAQEAAGIISNLAINIFSFFILFFAAQIIFFLLAKLLHLFTKLPVVNQFNRFLGFLFGTLKGVVVLYAAFALLIPVLSFAPNQNIGQKIDQSVIGSELYHNNMLIRLMNPDKLLSIDSIEH